MHPQDQLAQAHGPEEMNILLERSRAEGLIGAEQTELLTSMLRLQQTTVRDVLIPDDQLVTVTPGPTPPDIEAASLRSGRSRLAVVGDGRRGGGRGARPRGGPGHHRGPRRDGGGADGPAVHPGRGGTVTDAVTAMRAGRAQLAMVTRDGAAGSASSPWKTCWSR